MEQENEQFTNVRFESIPHYKMVAEIKHDMRMNKITSVTKEENQTFIFNYINGIVEVESYFMNTEKAKNIGQSVIDILPDIEQRHRKLLRKNKNQSLNKKRVNSFNMGVLTFSDSMRDLVETDLQKVLDLGRRTIEEMCKEVDIKLHYISFHMDEDGTPHFHFFTDNFNSLGNTINPKRNKNLGQKLQDLGNDYFDQLGFKRGISKELSGRKHLSIREYKDYQETLKENQRLKKEIEEMKSLEAETMETIIQLVSDLYEIGVNYKGRTVEELLDLFKRYFEDEKEFEKLFDKVVKLAKKKGLFDGWDMKGKITLSELQQAYKEGKTIADKKKDTTIKR